MKNVVVLFAAAVVAYPALARPALQCNKAQTKCLTENTRLSIGDQVGIFNTDGELVAKGEVMAMRGEKRALKIDRRHGKIRQSYSLALIEQDKAFLSKDTITSYSVYREPADRAVGASIGLGNVSIGDSSPATEISAYGSWRSLWDTQLIMRGVFQSTEGEIIGYGDGDEALDVSPVSVRGIGLLGGAAYVMRRQHTLSFRSELAAGLMHIAATVDGDSALVDGHGYRVHVSNGFAPYGRTSFGAQLNFDSWHVNGDVAFSLVSEAFTKVLAVGATKDLD